MSVEPPLPPPAPEGQPGYHGHQFLECESQSPLLEVWRARSPQGEQKWVKIVSGLARKHTLSAEELKRVAHLKFVRHPRLLPYETIENEQGRLVVVTPRAEFSLRKRQLECQHAGLPGVPRDELLVYLQAAAEGLDFLNRQESLHHLSLSPSDLVVLDGEVRVCDYGLVQLAWMPAGQPLDAASLRYAAPELFDNEFSKSSDQYSLALIYCEALSGMLPFSATMAKQMRQQRQKGEPDLHLAPSHDVPALAQALHRDPARRFDSVSEFVQALDDAAPPKPDSTRRRRVQVFPQGHPADQGDPLGQGLGQSRGDGGLNHRGIGGEA